MGRREHRGSWLARFAALTVAAAIAIPILASGTHVRAASTLFAPYQSFALGSDTKAVAIGDVTGDGRADIVATSAQGFYADYRVFVFASLPDGTLAAPVSYPTGGSGSNRIESVAIGDITDDGRADVVVGAAGLGVLVFPQLATGALGTPIVIDTPHTLRVAVGELDGSPAPTSPRSAGATTCQRLPQRWPGRPWPRRRSTRPATAATTISRSATSPAMGSDDIVVMSGQLYATPNVSVLAQLAGGGFGAAAEYSVAIRSTPTASASVT